MLRYAAEFADRYDKIGADKIGADKIGADKIGADRIGGNVSRRAESIEGNYKMGAPYVCLKFAY